MNKKSANLASVIILVILCVVWAQLERTDQAPDNRPAVTSEQNDRIAQAFQDEESGLQVAGEGIVERVLKDDNDGSRHQRFILQLKSGPSLLVAHNIDLAPRIPELQEGDTVAFYGVYEWNAMGGVIHWTHHDPAGRHEGGWLKHNGETYQ